MWHRWTDEEREAVRRRFTTHGWARHPLYGTWHGIVQRCENPAHPAYEAYGARGIRIFDRWHDVGAFITDVECEIGPRPDGRTKAGWPLYTLDRIDNDGNYEPGNVRWATAQEQATNKRPRRPRSPHPLLRRAPGGDA
jgi:hypothetical protein